MPQAGSKSTAPVGGMVVGRQSSNDDSRTDLPRLHECDPCFEESWPGRSVIKRFADEHYW